MLIPHLETISPNDKPERMTKINRFTSPRMFVDHYVLLTGQSQRPHVHQENDKVYFVLEGEGLFQLGEEEHRLSVGEGCVAAAGVTHGVRNESPERLVVLVVMAPNPL